MVAVWTTVDPNHYTIPVGDTNRPLQVDVQGAYSTDAGLTWTNFTVRGSLSDDVTTGTSAPTPDRKFNYVTDAAVSFDPNDQSFYVTYIQQNAASGGSAGELDLRKFDFSTATPQGQTPNVLYQWAPNSDIGGIYTPTVAVDGNAPSFTDTDTNGNTYTQTDPYSGNVYVAWVEGGIRGSSTKYNVVMIGSSDGGATFTNPSYLNTDFADYSNAYTNSYHPQIAISQGTPTRPGGQVSVVWDANTGSTQYRHDRGSIDGGWPGQRRAQSDVLGTTADRSPMPSTPAAATVPSRPPRSASTSRIPRTSRSAT